MKDVLLVGDVILLSEKINEKSTTLTFITTTETELSGDATPLKKKVGAYNKKDLTFGQMQETENIPKDENIQNLITDNTIVVDAPLKYELRQVPKINGAIMVMDPHTGRVLAMVGGWDFEKSKFNRAVQAKRQPGSAVKPFVYLTALITGITPAEMILDAPFVLQDSDGRKWKPTNFSKQFYGLQLLRVGIEKSLNLMTVRLAQKVGMEQILNTLKVFNIMDNAKPYLSYTLGAGETTLMQMLSGYSMIINGGKRITSSLIDRIQDRYGKTLYRHTPKLCTQCSKLTDTMPQLPDTREQVVNPVIAYQITSMLQGVVQRGSGRNLRDLNMSLAGKTGTTNDNRDAWFIGGTPDLVVGAYIGFDVPRELGNYKKWNIWFQETGGSAALPMVKEFLRQAKPSMDKIPFRVPKGVRFVRLDKETGRRVTSKTKYSQLEAFIPGTEPKIMTKQERESTILQQNNNGLEFGTIY